jgi:hypothetical protein
MPSAILIEHRTRIARVAGTLALSTAMATWADLVLFAKSVVEREWLNRLPQSIQRTAAAKAPFIGLF